jgi:peptidyl-prolyl cis-trans isomerase A (cyclophilin A)
MKISIFIVFLFTFFNSFSQSTVITCEISTSLGIITVELYPNKAPTTVTNFMNYVNNGYYDNTHFYRVCTPENEADRKIKIEVIQGGNINDKLLFDSIALETTQKTNLKHLNGAISMARDTPNSAQSSFFICIGNQPELDFGGKRNPDGQGFAVFGYVVKGMEVVQNIQKGTNKDQLLLNPILIYSIRKI